MLNSVSTQAARAYTIGGYLHEFHEEIGTDAYRASFVRKQHFMGNNCFGINNSGSNDCFANAVRGVTDSLGLHNQRWKEIYFVSESCRDITTRNRDLHRVEHTIEISGFAADLEREFIEEGIRVDPAKLAIGLIESQVIALIEQEEERRGADLAENFDPERPFSRYSSRIFCRNENSWEDVSQMSYEDIRSINRCRFSELIDSLGEYDFRPKTTRMKSRLIASGKNHSMPPIKEAARLSVREDADYALIKYYYHYKLLKISDPNSKWHNPELADRFRRWNLEFGQDIEPFPTDVLLEYPDLFDLNFTLPE